MRFTYTNTYISTFLILSTHLQTQTVITNTYTSLIRSHSPCHTFVASLVCLLTLSCCFTMICWRSCFLVLPPHSLLTRSLSSLLLLNQQRSLSTMSVVWCVCVGVRAYAVYFSKSDIVDICYFIFVFVAYSFTGSFVTVLLRLANTVFLA